METIIKKPRQPRSENKAEPHIVELKALISKAMKAEVQLLMAKDRAGNAKRKSRGTVGTKMYEASEAWEKVKFAVESAILILNPETKALVVEP
jgi:hypothetical protein